MEDHAPGVMFILPAEMLCVSADTSNNNIGTES